METSTAEIFAESTVLMLSGLLGLALFFILVGVRETRDHRPEGYLYLTVAVFLSVAHAVILEDFMSGDLTLPLFGDISIWFWLVVFFAPALIAVFFMRSLLNFAVARHQEGLIKVFFGLTLFCFLYMLGSHWPMDVRGILTIIWLGLFFKTEMAVTN